MCARAPSIAAADRRQQLSLEKGCSGLINGVSTAQADRARLAATRLEEVDAGFEAATARGNVQRGVPACILRIEPPSCRAGNKVRESFHGVALRGVVDGRLSMGVLCDNTFSWRFDLKLEVFDYITFKNTSALLSIQAAAALLAPDIAATWSADHPLLVCASQMVRVAPRRPNIKSDTPSASFSIALAWILFQVPCANGSTFIVLKLAGVLFESSRNSLVRAHSALFTSESREMLSSILLARSHDILVRFVFSVFTNNRLSLVCWPDPLVTPSPSQAPTSSPSRSLRLQAKAARSDSDHRHGERNWRSKRKLSGRHILKP